ncbi:DMT family transporter [Pararhodobacter marinus]|uniref:EamA family transporter n=1 Tax=Pararhodobacter marinus TaxID=2184063 RepID=A0A2U2C8M1_9RHOB|nr:EamA family transporter [Pararhodobacter marinus]
MNALNTRPDPAPAANGLPEPRDQRPVAGVLYMLGAGLCFVALTAGVKVLGGTIPAAQSAFLRYALGLIFVLPAIGTLRRISLPSRVWWAFGWRGVVHSLAVLLWFFAMTRIPLAEVSAMGYLNPIWITIGAALFLGEGLKLRRIMAIIVAIAGAMVILRPGMRALDLGHFAMLATSLGFGISYLMAKPLSALAPPSIVVGMLSLTVTIGLAPFALAVWVPVSWEQLGLLFLIASVATGAHFLMTMAFVAAPITVTQPVTALQLVWAVALGAIFFGEPVDPYVVAGGVMVVAAVIFIALREHQLRLREKSESVVP